MRRSDNRAALTDEVARFQAEVQHLAFAAARAIVQEELDRRLAKLEPARRRGRKPARSDTAAASAAAVPATAGPATAGPAAMAPGSTASAAPGSTAPGSTGPAATASGPTAPGDPASGPDTAREQPPDRPTGKKRVPWTREAIINELATWMLSGTAIDATFVTRHGPPGLVAATRRIFGRFDAALNVAGLHVSKLYPDGPPARTVG